jgi:hypothetical protein
MSRWRANANPAAARITFARSKSDQYDDPGSARLGVTIVDGSSALLERLDMVRQ